MNGIPHIHLLGLGNQVAAVLLADKRDTHDTMPPDPDIHGASCLGDTEEFRVKDVHVVTWQCVKRPVYSKAVGKLESINHDIIAAHFSMSMIVHHCNAPLRRSW
jgi:hypothetical protein